MGTYVFVCVIMATVGVVPVVQEYTHPLWYPAPKLTHSPPPAHPQLNAKVQELEEAQQKLQEENSEVRGT